LPARQSLGRGGYGLERPSVLVGALVRYRGVKVVQEVSLDSMDLNEIDPDNLTALDSVDKGLLHFSYFCQGHSLGLGIAIGEGNIAGTPD